MYISTDSFPTLKSNEISVSSQMRFVQSQHRVSSKCYHAFRRFVIWRSICTFPLSTYLSAAAAEHGCCAAAAASRRRELRLMTDVAESCAPFPLQLHHAPLQLHLLPFPLSLTDTDSTTVLDAHVFSPLHEFGASCPLPKIMVGETPLKYPRVRPKTRSKQVETHN